MTVWLAGKQMGPILSREQVRLLDRLAMEKYGMSGLVLMENAGRGAVDVLCRVQGCFPAESASSVQKRPPHPVGAAEGVSEPKTLYQERLCVEHRDFGGPVVICCGRGNNAGDGLVMARHLWLRGHSVRVFLWGNPEELSPDAAANYAILQKAGFSMEWFGRGHEAERLAPALAEASWIVDALLGTGARGQPRPPLDAVIAQINQAGKPVLAVDLPSGLDCDTGQPAEPTIRAALTCTFAAAKLGLLHAEAQQYVGQLVVVDIGTPPILLDQVLAHCPPAPPTW